MSYNFDDVDVMSANFADKNDMTDNMVTGI